MSTEKPRDGSYRLNVKVIRAYLTRENMGPKALASKAGVDRTSLERWLKGGPARLSHIIALAGVMKAGIQSICLDTLPEHATALETPGAAAQQSETEGGPAQQTVDISVKLPAESMKTWTDEKRANLCEGLRLIIAVGGKVNVVAEAEGCMKVTVRLTPEQAAALVRAHGEGKLAALGISELIVEPVPVPPPVPPTPPAPPPRPVWQRIKASHVSMAISFACSLSGVFPIEALPAYLVGILSGLASLVLRWRLPRGRWIPAALITLNGGAAAAWPNVIGVFRDPDGYHFRADERERYGELHIISEDDVPPLADADYRKYRKEGGYGYLVVSKYANATREYSDYGPILLYIIKGPIDVKLQLPAGYYYVTTYYTNTHGHYGYHYVHSDFYGVTTVRLRGTRQSVEWVIKGSKN